MAEGTNLLHAVPHLSDGSLINLTLHEWDDLIIRDQLAVDPLDHHGALELGPFASLFVPEIGLDVGIEGLKLRKTAKMFAGQC